MGVVRAISVSSFENDKTENNGNGLEDEDPGEVPNSIVDVSSINLRAGGPSGKIDCTRSSLYFPFD